MVNGKKANLTKAVNKSSFIYLSQNILQFWSKMLIVSSALFGGYSHDYNNQKEGIFLIFIFFFLFLNIPPGLVLPCIFYFTAKNSNF
jgi:hypothetical protein